MEFFELGHNYLEELHSVQPQSSSADEHYTSILKSTVIVVKAALPSLRESGGSMTHIVAATAREPPTGLIFTSTIRSGLFGLSKSHATEYASDGIRSNCVCPRSVMTGRLESKTELTAQRRDLTFEEALDEREAALPIGRLGKPEEFARMVTYVASPAAGFLTGTVVPVDGGWSKGHSKFRLKKWQKDAGRHSRYISVTITG